MRNHIARTLANPKATRLLILLAFVGLTMAVAADPAAAQRCVDGEGSLTIC